MAARLNIIGIRADLSATRQVDEFQLKLLLLLVLLLLLL